jgi:hypothetical protein
MPSSGPWVLNLGRRQDRRSVPHRRRCGSASGAARGRARADRGPALQGQSAKATEPHTCAECALRDHPTLGALPAPVQSGRLRIDGQRIAAKERLDGKFLLSTSDVDLNAEDVALGHKNL